MDYSDDNPAHLVPHVGSTQTILHTKYKFLYDLRSGSAKVFDKEQGSVVGDSIQAESINSIMHFKFTELEFQDGAVGMYWWKSEVTNLEHVVLKRPAARVATAPAAVATAPAAVATTTTTTTYLEHVGGDDGAAVDDGGDTAEDTVGSNKTKKKAKEPTCKRPAADLDTSSPKDMAMLSKRLYSKFYHGAVKAHMKAGLDKSKAMEKAREVAKREKDKAMGEAKKGTKKEPQA